MTDLRVIHAAVAFTVLPLAGGVVIADDVCLHPHAVVVGPDVTLAQVADLDGADAVVLGPMLVGRFGTGQGRVRVTLGEVRRILNDGRVNWARLSLKGFTTCIVRRGFSNVPDAASAGGTETEKWLHADGIEPVCGSVGTGGGMANPVQPIDISPAKTLRDRTLEWIEAVTRSKVATLRITFSERDETTLATEAVTGRYEFAAQGHTTLGHMSVQINRYRGPELVDSYRISPIVEKRVIATVATETIGRGKEIHLNQVELSEVYLDRDDQEVIGNPETLEGRIATTMLRPGTIIQQRHARVPSAVDRGDIIQVRCFVGDLIITTTARAMEEGSLGELVQVRNEHRDSRKTFSVRLTGPRQAVLEPDDISLVVPVSRDAGSPDSSFTPIL